MSTKKLDKDFMTIGEFAKLTGMTVSALNYYDRIGVFHPATRGDGPMHKYRYYSATQVTTVKMIRVLAEIGVPLDTIRELAQNRTPEKLLKVLSQRKRMLADEIRFLQDAHSVIGTFMELLCEGMSIMEEEIYVAEMPERPIILGNPNDFNGESGYAREFTRFCNTLHEPKLNTSYPIGGYFESMDVFLNEPSQPTHFFSLDPKGHEKKEAGLYLIGHTHGHYGQTNGLPEKMAAFARRNGLLFNGPVYNVYLFDELSVTEPNRHLLQVAASVTETRRVPSRRPRYHL